MEVFGYRKLIAYQKAKEVVKHTYCLLASVKDKIHFIEIAYGSLMEVSSQFEIAEELGYITPEERLSMDKLVEEVARLLSGLRSSFQPNH